MALLEHSFSTINSDDISAAITYVIWCKEHFSVLQTIQLSNLDLGVIIINRMHVYMLLLF
jgi:hypothetical protein